MARLTREQLEQRRKGIGSSDVSAILGISPYKGHNSIALVLDKRGLIALPDEGDDDESDALYLGHELEVVAARAYERDQKCTLLVTGTTQSSTHHWAFATLDRRVKDVDRLVECKAVGRWMMWDRELRVARWDPADPFGVPYDVLVQRTWQSWVSGVLDVDIAAILTGTEFHIFRIPYDAALAQRLVDVCGEWWEKYMVRGDDPEPDGSESARTYLRLKYPKAAPPLLLDATPEQDRLGLKWLDESRRLDACKVERERLTQLLIADLGERAVGIKGNGWRCTYKPDKNGKRSFRLQPSKGETDAPE